MPVARCRVPDSAFISGDVDLDLLVKDVRRSGQPGLQDLTFAADPSLWFISDLIL